MSSKVIFLKIYEIVLLHENQIKLYGGIKGIRDLSLLKSAVETPKATFGGEYLHKTIYDKASAYIFHISKNHPFLDGNKRTALASGLLFLELNGIDTKSINDGDELYDLMINVSNGKLSKKEIVSFLKTCN